VPRLLADTTSDTVDAVIGLSAFVLVLIGLIVVLVVVLRHRRAMRELAIRAQAAGRAATAPVFSPDGAQWWDGQSWVPCDAVPPPTAMRSPDGAYWYDGGRWRPVRPGPSPTGGP
jgi:hypothetical protein